MKCAGCKGCKFWKQDAEWKEAGECRRNAPSAPITRERYGKMARRDVAMFPYTAASDWCGEFEPEG